MVFLRYLPVIYVVDFWLSYTVKFFLSSRSHFIFGFGWPKALHISLASEFSLTITSELVSVSSISGGTEMDSNLNMANNHIKTSIKYKLFIILILRSWTYLERLYNQFVSSFPLYWFDTCSNLCRSPVFGVSSISKPYSNNEM